GLAGIPLTEEYAIWVAQHPAPALPPTEPNREPPSWRAVSPTAVATVTTPKPQAAQEEAQAKPVKKARSKAARVSLNADDEEGANIKPKRNRDPVVSIFQDIFGLSADSDKPRKKKKKRKAQDWN